MVCLMCCLSDIDPHQCPITFFFFNPFFANAFIAIVIIVYAESNSMKPRNLACDILLLLSPKLLKIGV